MILFRALIEAAAKNKKAYSLDHPSIPDNVDHLNSRDEWSQHNTISSDLHKKLMQKNDMHGNGSDVNNLYKYTKTEHNPQTQKAIIGSASLNKKLISNQELDTEEKAKHDSIHRLKHAVGRNLHVYSGISQGFGDHILKLEKHEILHSPAHMSTTHRLSVAHEFAGDKAGEDEDTPLHLLHIHLKPRDKITHVSRISHFKNEHESIIPSGANLKYQHTTQHQDKNRKLYIHHVEVHSQD